MDAHGDPRLMDLEERADLAFGREDTIYRGGEHRAD
jgi:hypothetical protein